MTYAVIADIHGNYPAFRAVLKDAAAQGAEAYLLLGDYLRDFPFANEIIDAMRKLPDCTAIMGNGDEQICSRIGLDISPDSTTGEHIIPVSYTARALTADNAEWLKSLPETAGLIIAGKTVRLTHNIPMISHNPRIPIFHSGGYMRLHDAEPLTFDEGIAKMRATAEEHSDEVSEFEGDIILFGHNHLQFCGECAGKLLLNPGSCGLPLDLDTRAPYALLRSENGGVTAELRRVEYDRGETITGTRNSDFYKKATFWCDIHIRMLEQAKDFTSDFWRHMRGIDGWSGFPIQNDIWRRGIATFENLRT
jgi:predicted phosphodiesterase